MGGGQEPGGKEKFVSNVRWCKSRGEERLGNMQESLPDAGRRRKQSTMLPILRKLLVLGGVVMVLGYVGISLLVAWVLGKPPRQDIVGTPQSEGDLAYEDITFPARGDRVPISAWFIPHANSNKAIILVHGKGQCRTCEFNGKSLSLAVALQQRGFHILMLDLRGHGRSGDGLFTFGLRERRDVLGAVDWLRNRGFEAGRIGLLGVSMGAASSIGAASEEPAIGALVVDSSYAEFFPVLEKAFPKESHLPGFFLPSTLLALRLMGGEDVARVRPVDEMRALAPRPTLIIHAEGDQLIPLSHAHQLQAANPAAELWVIPAKEHAKTYNDNPQRYVERVAAFFAAHL